jgi:hypothetical protein
MIGAAPLARARRVAAMVVLLASASAGAGQPATFKNATAGFEVTKPAGWAFRTAEENQEHLKDMQLADQEFQAAMLKYATAPLVIMTKHPEPFADLNPTFKVNVKPLGPLKGTAPDVLLGEMLPQLQKAFEAFTIEQAPTVVDVSGLKAGYVRANYVLKTTIRTYPATAEIWIVPRGDYFFMMAAGTRQDEKTGSRDEIQTIIKSIKLRP